MNGQQTRAMYEALTMQGKVTPGTPNPNEATTVMSQVPRDPNATAAIPAVGSQAGTTVMPATMAPVEDLPDYDRAPNNKRNYVIGAVTAGVVLVGAIIFLLSTMGGTNAVVVPAVAGQTCEVAKTTLEQAGFVVAITPADAICDAVGIVQTQSPGGGEGAIEGETITLALAANTVEVPPVVGLTEQAARAAIEGAGFVFARGPDVIDKTFALGQVVLQNPAGRSQLAKGGTVSVNISGGTGRVAIPTVVIGQTTEAASAFLQAEPYAFVVTIAEEANDTAVKGTVVRTSPVVGQLLDKGAAVTLYVSSGPKPVTMPNLVGQTEAAAVARLTTLKLNISIEYEDDPRAGVVIFQGTKAGTLVLPGTEIVLMVGRSTPPSS
jgi:serine/threonine-protein kinase